MKLNTVEKALMNNPIRAAVQRHYETRIPRHLGGPAAGGRALEMGCGQGVGAEIILDRFGAATVDAFDLDPDMVDRAHRRLSCFGDRVRLWVGDATHIAAPDAAYDAVFDFGIIHHVPDWTTAVAEVARVLRNGGTFYFEEVTRRALDLRASRLLFEHPTDNRFSGDELIAACEHAGLRVADRHTEQFFGYAVFGAAQSLASRRSRRPEPNCEPACGTPAIADHSFGGRGHGDGDMGPPAGDDRQHKMSL